MNYQNKPISRNHTHIKALVVIISISTLTGIPKEEKITEAYRGRKSVQNSVVESVQNTWELHRIPWYSAKIAMEFCPDSVTEFHGIIS